MCSAGNQPTDNRERSVGEAAGEVPRYAALLPAGQDNNNRLQLVLSLQDLNLTESELKRANEENRRLREETTLMPEKSVLDSKEKQIKKLNENIKNLEVEYDNILQQKDKEKMRADKLERDSKPVNAKIEQLEADLKHALKMNDSQENNLEKDIVMFNQVNCQSSLQQPFSQTIQTAQSLNSWSGLLSETF